MARPKKPVDDLKDQRVVVMLSTSELNSIDDWMFANRIRSRGEAMRRLIVAGLVKDIKKTEDKKHKRLMLEGGE